MQIAFLIVTACRGVGEQGVEVADLPRQSQPSSSELASVPMPYSPTSKAFLRYCVGPMSP